MINHNKISKSTYSEEHNCTKVRMKNCRQFKMFLSTFEFLQLSRKNYPPAFQLLHDANLNSKENEFKAEAPHFKMRPNGSLYPLSCLQSYVL